MSIVGNLKLDYKKYKKYGGNFISIFLLTQGFWAIFQYRIANSCYKIKNKVLRKIILMPCIIWQKIIEILTGITLPYSAEIGHSFYIGHYGGIILNANTVIGDNCNISQGVTIGVSGNGKNRGVPLIGNNVYIGAGAVLVGKITIGDNCVVAANSLVIDSVMQETTVVGVPAKLHSDKNSKNYI